MFLVVARFQLDRQGVIFSKPREKEGVRKEGSGRRRGGQRYGYGRGSLIFVFGCFEEPSRRGVSWVCTEGMCAFLV